MTFRRIKLVNDQQQLLRPKRARLIDAGCKWLHSNAKFRCELWQNKHGKTLRIDCTDTTFQEY